MSILIKGMKMPNACYECEFYNEVCPFDGVGVWYDPLRERADGCPLLEVPDHASDHDAEEKWNEIAEKSEEECEDENWHTELDDPKIAERSNDGET